MNDRSFTYDPYSAEQLSELVRESIDTIVLR